MITLSADKSNGARSRARSRDGSGDESVGVGGSGVVSSQKGKKLKDRQIDYIALVQSYDNLDFTHYDLVVP